MVNPRPIITFINSPMLQASKVSEKDVQRSLDRLKTISTHNDLSKSLPAFYYSAEILMKYAKQHGVEGVDSRHFDNYNRELTKCTSQDTSDMKQHQKQILNEIFDITTCQTFLRCSKSEMKANRMDYLKDDISETGSISNENSKLGLANSIQKKASFEQANKGLIENGSKVGQANKGVMDNGNKKQQGQKIWNELLIAYRDHNIDEAYALKNKYLELKQPMEDEKHNLFETIELEYTTMIRFYKQFDQDGWIMDKQEKGVTLEYKVFEEEKQIAIRIESEFNVKIQNFLAILCEMDLFGTYVPFCYDSKECKVISRNEKIGTSKIYIPCLTDRETYFYAAGYDRYKTNGSVFLFSKTINEDTLYQEKYGYKVPEKSDLIRLQYKFFIVEYIPITKEKARLRLASKVDMKLNFLPQFILNMSARKFAFDYFKNILKVNKKFEGSEWDKKIKEKPDFYKFFERKIDEYMSDK